MMCTGSKPKVTPPAPPPIAPDEADAVPTANFLAQRAATALFGYRRAFLSGPRGPGGPAWQAPETPPAPPSTGDGTLPPPRAVPVTTPTTAPAQLAKDRQMGAPSSRELTEAQRRARAGSKPATRSGVNR